MEVDVVCWAVLLELLFFVSAKRRGQLAALTPHDLFYHVLSVSGLQGVLPSHEGHRFKLS